MREKWLRNGFSGGKQFVIGISGNTDEVKCKMGNISANKQQNLKF